MYIIKLLIKRTHSLVFLSFDKNIFTFSSKKINSIAKPETNKSALYNKFDVIKKYKNEQIAEIAI